MDNNVESLKCKSEAMSDEVKCSCQRCGEHIAFPVLMAGQNVICPHCGKETTLTPPMVRKGAPTVVTEKPTDKKTEQPLATKIMMLIIAIAGMIIAILIYNWRVSSLTKALTGF